MDIKEGRCCRTISDTHGHFVTALSLSPVNPVLISGSVDKSIGIWACSQKEKVKKIKMKIKQKLQLEVKKKKDSNRD